VLIEHDGRRPRVADSAYLAPTAVVCGDVEIGEDCRVLSGAVPSADGGPIEVRAGAIVMENAIVRERRGQYAELFGSHRTDRILDAAGQP